MTLTPSRGKNHNLPSADLATRGVVPLVNEWLLTPSELSNTVAWIVRFGSAAHASNSGRAIRTRPQAMYSPERMEIVFHHPLNGIAGQSILAGKRGNTTVFHPA